PSSAPDAKASTMRSYTLTPTQTGLVECVRKFHTKNFLTQRKSHYTPASRLVLDARVHYTILKPLPNTTPNSSHDGLCLGWVGDL
ncbi:hypothetical protein, partial [Brevibacterium casei]